MLVRMKVEGDHPDIKVQVTQNLGQAAWWIHGELNAGKGSHGKTLFMQGDLPRLASSLPPRLVSSCACLQNMRKFGYWLFQWSEVSLVGSTYPMFCSGTTSPGDAFKNGRACSWETALVVYWFPGSCVVCLEITYLAIKQGLCESTARVWPDPFRMECPRRSSSLSVLGAGSGYRLGQPRVANLHEVGDICRCGHTFEFGRGPQPRYGKPLGNVLVVANQASTKSRKNNPVWELLITRGWRFHMHLPVMMGSSG